MKDKSKENIEDIEKESENINQIKEEEVAENTEQEVKIETDENEKEEKQVSVAELQEKISSLQDTLLRKVAEFENYKRRTENDQLNLLKYAAESFILKVLPIYDDLQRSLSHLGDSNLDSIKEGLKLVLDKFTKSLDDQGIKKIDVVGKEFDVDYHEALLQQPSENFHANIVMEEIEPGYLYKDKVIKHSKVIVSKGTETVQEDNSDTNNESEE